MGFCEALVAMANAGTDRGTDVSPWHGRQPLCSMLSAGCKCATRKCAHRPCAPSTLSVPCGRAARSRCPLGSRHASRIHGRDHCGRITCDSNVSI